MSKDMKKNKTNLTGLCSGLDQHLCRSRPRIFILVCLVYIPGQLSGLGPYILIQWPITNHALLYSLSL